jgi:hypothetical protein
MAVRSQTGDFQAQVLGQLGYKSEYLRICGQDSVVQTKSSFKEKNEPYTNRITAGSIYRVQTENFDKKGLSFE